MHTSVMQVRVFNIGNGDLKRLYVRFDAEGCSTRKWYEVFLEEESKQKFAAYV